MGDKGTGTDENSSAPGHSKSEGAHVENQHLDERVRSLEVELQRQEMELGHRGELIRELRSTVDILEGSLAWTFVNRVVWPVTAVLFPKKLRSTKAARLLRSGIFVLVNRGAKETWHRTRLRFLRRQISSEDPVRSDQSSRLEEAWELPRLSAQLDMRPIAIRRNLTQATGVTPVTIVICVFNALGDLKDCLESVRKNTDIKRHQVTIVDDCSSQPGMSEYLADVSQYWGGRITVLINQQRYGYVASANRGMSTSDGDVILLNSDTVVTDGWVEKLQRAAYSSDSVATVTPFTNNGVLCSVPEFGRYNEIPEGFSVEDFAALIDRISRREYPEIPTSVGFCSYVKRSVLDEIGDFDVDKFEFGYGEEVDFSFRAVDAGYSNILDDSTFIFHRGGASFGQKEKIVGEARATENIWSLHPRLMADAQHFLQTNPLRPFQDRIKFFSSTSRQIDAIKVLQVGPYGFEASIGGSILHTKDLIEALRREPGCQVSMIYPVFPDHDQNAGYFLDHFDEQGFDRIHLLFNRYYDRVFYSTPEHPVPMAESARHNVPEPVRHLASEEMFCDLLRLFEFDVVHFQHFLGGFPISLLKRCRDMRVASVVTVHDYFLFCYNFTLFENPHKLFCDFSTDDKRCESCLGHHWRVTRDFQSKRRSEINELLPFADRIVVPSNYLRKKVLELHPTLDGDKCLVIPHAASLNRSTTTVSEGQPDSSLRVAFVGFFGVEKGSRTFAQVVSNLSRQKGYEWHIFGEVRDWDSLAVAQSRSEVNVHGRYDRDDLSDLLAENRIDVGVLLSGWPETYSYTYSELRSCGIPIVGLDVGALGDRIRSEEGGVAVDPNRGAAGVAEVLEGFRVDRNHLESLRDMWNPPSREEVGRYYLNLYRKLCQ